jgi:hypothetical protein
VDLGTPSSTLSRSGALAHLFSFLHKGDLPMSEANTQEAAVVDSGVLEATAPESEVAAPAPAAASAMAETKVEISLGQMSVLIQEIAAIEKTAQRAANLAADCVGPLHLKVDEAIRTQQVSKQLLEEIRDKLAVQNAATLTAILCANLSTRLNPSVTDLYSIKTQAQETV